MTNSQYFKFNAIESTDAIVGIDIAKNVHWAGIILPNGKEIKKSFSFHNNKKGFESLVETVKNVLTMLNFEKVIIGMEPTGHYWKSCARYLKDIEWIKVVTVNPFHVKNAKEFDDNCQTKNDKKDCMTIARLIKDARFFEPYLPEGIWAELRNLSNTRAELIRKQSAVKCRLVATIDEYFPEYTKVFKNILSRTSEEILKECPFPEDIKSIGKESLLKHIKEKVKRGYSKKQVEEIYELAKESIGTTEGSENITKDFLEKILKRKIEKIELEKNPILAQELEEDKLGILDILTELEGKEKCNIELQIVNRHNIVERILYYWARIYTKQLKAGEYYDKLKKTIVILISDFRIKGLEELGYHSTWKIMETGNSKKLILTDKFEIDIIELSKIEGKENEKDQLLDWLMFLENPESERVIRKMEENENLKEAVEKLDYINSDEHKQRIIELREKAIRDERAIYLQGIEDGEEKGKISGRLEGKLEGKLEGAKEEKIEIAKNMLKENISIEVIVKITGLAKEEIEKLQKSLANVKKL